MFTLVKCKQCSFWRLSAQRSIFIYGCFLIFLSLGSCKEKNPCEWRTAAALDRIDRKKCLAHSPSQDSLYAQLRNFSLSFNPSRKEKGIPLLSPDVECLSLCEGDVRWAGDIRDGEYVPPSHPYLKWKTIQWRSDTLLADRSLFVENAEKDRWGKTLVINYYLDTLSRKEYRFEYLYSPGNPAPDILFSRQQADSLLSLWGLSY